MADSAAALTVKRVQAFLDLRKAQGHELVMRSDVQAMLDYRAVDDVEVQPTKQHHPVGAYYPIGQLDGDCSCGRGVWPCPDAINEGVRNDLT